MNRFSSGGDRDILQVNNYNGCKTTWPQQGIASLKVNLSHVQTNNRESFKKMQQGKTMEANSERAIRIMPPAIQSDTFVDNTLGDALRKTKAMYGSAPFIEAYNKALKTAKEINDRRKRCLEEEVKQRSIFYAGED
ncbi:MAG TPA: hypothetical protein PLZ44_01925 [Methanothrix sp.]|jgi:hypothetical protein|nr:hypothetical protein [Methanothrix sp.]